MAGNTINPLLDTIEHYFGLGDSDAEELLEELEQWVSLFPLHRRAVFFLLGLSLRYLNCCRRVIRNEGISYCVRVRPEHPARLLNSAYRILCMRYSLAGRATPSAATDQEPGEKLHKSIDSLMHMMTRSRGNRPRNTYRSCSLSAVSTRPVNALLRWLGGHPDVVVVRRTGTDAR